ncbi:MFS transporter [Planococcus lenghuensis]|uniref:Major facilitator superfamily (MFS) profile domain-containing protein n=1 Tax=Planococcus lenghuensis TaxID=2213202 RepID=A0A1Q2L5F0_9BACL|nr:MFS transporter [Planococcus lenghuensis]AQQ55631.1 hypothetical protein B0X71_20875 [Planococcus lenghuensis]
MLNINKNLTTYVITTILSRSGVQIQQIAIVLYLLHIGGTASTLSLYFIASFIPSIIMGPLGGVIADRIPPKRVLQVTYIARAILLLFVPLIPSVWGFYLFSFCFSIIDVFMRPSLGTLLPKIAEERNLTAIISYVSTSRSIIDTAVPIIGASIVYFIGYDFVFYATALLYFFSFVGVSALRVKHQPDPVIKKRESISSDIKDGFKYIFSADKTKTILIVASFMMFLSSGIKVLLPIHVLNYMGFPEFSFGLVVGTIGLGLTAGGLLIPKIKKNFTISQILCFAILLDGISIVAFALSSKVLGVFLIIMFIFGLASSSYAIMIDNYIQLKTEKNYLGRVYATYFTTINIVSSIGVILAGYMTEITNTRIVFLFCGIGILGIAIYFGKKQILKEKAIDYKVVS